MKMAKTSCSVKVIVRRKIELKQHKLSTHKKVLCTLRKKILHKLASKHCRSSVIVSNPNYHEIKGLEPRSEILLRFDWPLLQMHGRNSSCRNWKIFSDSVKTRINFTQFRIQSSSLIVSDLRLNLMHLKTELQTSKPLCGGGGGGGGTNVFCCP